MYKPPTVQTLIQQVWRRAGDSVLLTSEAAHPCLSVLDISVARPGGFAMVSRPLVAVRRNAQSFCHIAIIFLSFPGGSAGKESACNEGDLGSIPGLGKSPGDGNGYPFQYSGLENSMDCIVHGVAKSRTQLSDFHFHFVTCLGMLKNLLPPKLAIDLPLIDIVKAKSRRFINLDSIILKFCVIPDRSHCQR